MNSSESLYTLIHSKSQYIFEFIWIRFNFKAVAQQIQLKEIHNLAVKDLGLSEESSLDISNLNKLKEWLAHEIQMLIDRDFHSFLNMLYRIDVDEQKAKEAFSDNDPSWRLADLVIERELQKVESRRKYK